MNAVVELVQHLPRPAVSRRLPADQRVASVTRALRRRLADRYLLDLPGLLNGASRAELEELAVAVELPTSGTIGELRARLWEWGARRERRDAAVLGTPIQPVPIVLRGKLVHLGRGTGVEPDADERPRAVVALEEAPAAPEAIDEPETLEELLARADALVGVRMGRRSSDKGAWGTRIAALLGVRERGFAEPDWRGEVEIKTVPVVRDRAGWWRVKEDPAIGMEDVPPLSKLQRVLWIARVAEADSPILSWYYQELDASIEWLARRYLHTRPKGGAGATTRGWYLHKRFFVDSGFLRSLNG